jgi:hypothetical protein
MGLAVRRSNPGNSCQKRRHRLWSPPNRGSSPDVEWPGCDVNSPPSPGLRMSGDIPHLPLYAISVDEENFTFFPLTNSHMWKVSSHPTKGTCLTVPVGLAYPYRFYRLRVIHIGFQAFMVCVGKMLVFLGLSTTYLLTLYVEKARSFHKSVSAYDPTLCQDPEYLHFIHYSLLVQLVCEQIKS